MLQLEKRSQDIKTIASELGFSFAGIAKARRLDDEARRLEEWLNKGFHGRMSYMENHFEKRVDPTKLVPGAKSVISLMYNYYTDKKQQDPEAPQISKYALGEDYHVVIKNKLFDFLERIRAAYGEVQGRCFVDSAPVMERDWARNAGLGWKGKNTLLINPQAGSYFFLAELIVDLDLKADSPMRDYCGTCTRCITACPTEAITANTPIVDGSKCISYLTIELKDAIPDVFKGKMENWMFGCDVCQQVCPWNRFATEHQEPAFEPPETLINMSKRDWEEITEEVFKNIFKNSAVQRTKFKGLKRNIQFLGRS
ncbi:MAG: tRNA epoxyqueuosine(34) reductase QueG [Saprospiraceae bacterium]|nr:tRNA epoxyqueuosine(34) reductase QueG [Saprospiraceae bacterium]